MLLCLRLTWYSLYSTRKESCTLRIVNMGKRKGRSKSVVAKIAKVAEVTASKAIEDLAPEVCMEYSKLYIFITAWLLIIPYWDADFTEAL